MAMIFSVQLPAAAQVVEMKQDAEGTFVPKPAIEQETSIWLVLFEGQLWNYGDWLRQVVFRQA